MIRSGDQFRFLAHDGMTMEGGSCVAVPTESSMWTVLRRRSREDRSGLSVYAVRQDRHAQLSVRDDAKVLGDQFQFIAVLYLVIS